MERCITELNILDGKGNYISFQCQLELNHKGIHKHYGDNYCLTWLKDEHMIEYPEKVTDELRERCKKLLKVGALETAGDDISELI